MRAKNKMVYGAGINDASYMVEPSVNGKRVRCPYYTVWASMIRRCYHELSLEKFPAYKGCSVCSDWLTFSKFRAWMDAQDHKSKQLDKDIKVKGNKVYSPATCLFIPSRLNTLLVNCSASRGKWPLGVYWMKEASRFKVQIRIEGERKYVGMFTTSDAASRAYIIAKNAEIDRQSELYPQWKKYILQHKLLEKEKC